MKIRVLQVINNVNPALMDDMNQPEIEEKRFCHAVMCLKNCVTYTWVDQKVMKLVV